MIMQRAGLIMFALLSCMASTACDYGNERHILYTGMIVRVEYRTTSGWNSRNMVVLHFDDNASMLVHGPFGLGAIQCNVPVVVYQRPGYTSGCVQIEYGKIAKGD